MADHVYIRSTGLFTPAEAISNEELVASFNAYVARENEARETRGEDPLTESSAEFIERASGIKSRFVMNKTGILDIDRMGPDLPERPQDALSLQAEMATASAQDALDRAGLGADSIDAIIVACSNYQRPYPAIAVEVQNALGAGGFAYDMNVACSSATFGLQNAVDSIRSGSSNRVLVLSPEICSGHLDFRDRDCHFIFGDVSTAILVEGGDSVPEGAFEILDSRLLTRFSSNIRNDSGFLDRHDGSSPADRRKLFHQQGRRVFKDVCPWVSEVISEHLGEAGVPLESVSRFWLHQANLSMNALIAKMVLGREATREEAPVILDDYANTSSAGSVVAFHKYHEDLPAGSVGVLCSFGAGYSVGSVLLRRR